MEQYQVAKNTPSDICEHIPTLRQYAQECSHITELGVREPTSTWAFVEGLAKNGRLISVDIAYTPAIESVRNECTKKGITFHFVLGNDVTAPLEETDLLFIDTWHVYAHLKRELQAHAGKTRKYIIMHDTTVDEWQGESIREGCNIKEKAETSGYPENEIRCGLWPAINEFLRTHAEWKLHKRYINNNGLTILKRVQGV